MVAALLSLRVILGEDDPGLGELFTDALSREGYDVEICTDVKTSLARVAADPPSILVLDSALPPSGGLALVERLRKKGRLVFTVLLASAPDERLRKACLALPRVEYLAKPFSIQELLQALSRFGAL
jgi:two-component system OmpR family response regulator